MTLQELHDTFDSGKIEWATVENYFNQVVSDCQIKFKTDIDSANSAKSAAESALEERKIAIEKALFALESKDPEAAIDALAAISATKKTEQDKEVDYLNSLIADLQKQITEIQLKIEAVISGK